jgi:hypothetical protein
MKRNLKWVGRILGGLALVAVLAIAWMAYSFNKALKPIKSIDQYQDVLADWKGSGLIDHFPNSVPAEARNVKFSSFPGFLQGGGHVQLRVELPEAEVKSLYEHATKIAKQHQDGGSSVTLINEREDGLSSTSPHTLAEGTYEFSDDYRIFIFHAEPYRKGSGHDWNHGESAGMVVSLQRNEVLYYAENW